MARYTLASSVLRGALFLGLVLAVAGCGSDRPAGEAAAPEGPVFQPMEFTGPTPWTSADFQDDASEFRFVVIGDRTGGANAEGTFNLAVDQINLLQPEFVINVGDMIEGYSDDSAELHADWDQADGILAKLEMPFFRTPGNHDIANETAQQVWAER